MSTNNLEDVITDAITDSQIPEEPVEETSSEPVEASTSDATDVGDVPPVSAVEEPVEATESVTEPTEKVDPAAVQDDFEKRLGIPAVGLHGKENRIPYSRVKKINERSMAEVAEAALGRKLNAGEKPIDAVKQYVARIPELESKVTDYESRLEKVGQFEHIMQNEPDKFLQLLERVPAYQEFFGFVRQAYEQLNNPQAQTTAVSQTPAVEEITAEMPQPDEQMPDGSMSYSMDGIKKLAAWIREDAARSVNKTWEAKFQQLETRYKPIEEEWEAHHRIQQALPQIKAQIDQARTWPGFNENEEEITKVLQADQRISLEGAYQKVVIPKLAAEKDRLRTDLQADRDKMRQELLAELQKAPRATSLPTTKVAAKPQVGSGPRDLAEIIREQVETKLK
jgi:hypothetical protein